jgi:hypothetical protein
MALGARVGWWADGGRAGGRAAGGRAGGRAAAGGGRAITTLIKAKLRLQTLQ